jgi:formimidoylglutamate deiminase
MRFFAKQAMLPTGLTNNVMFEVKNGRWHKITPHTAPDNAERLNGLLIPALINTHSHAFQRVFAGQAETRENPTDDFWSWRVKMYQAALSLSPEELYEVAFNLYSEMVAGGYGHVCEFHYLHHEKDGSPYKNPYIMGEMLVEAASKAGLGITIMPVLYERAGFTSPTLQPDQRRFKTSPEWVLEAQKHFKGGVAIHSLRAASMPSIHSLLDKTGDVPIHIHVSEQTREVEECLALTGLRPIELIAPLLDKRWHLVHATHTVPREIELIAKSGASVVLCPATEANLGDGICDLTGFIKAGVPLSIGSDSHVSRSVADELRLLEYGQRLMKRQRVIADDMFSRVVNTSAAGISWGLIEGAPAKAYEISETLNEHIFSHPSKPYTRIIA